MEKGLDAKRKTGVDFDQAALRRFKLRYSIVTNLGARTGSRPLPADL